MNEPAIEFIAFIIYYAIAALVLRHFARRKNRSLAWAFIGPLFCVPAAVALALVSYLCPKCRGPITYDEWMENRCPRCGRFSRGTSAPESAPKKAYELYRDATKQEVKGDIEGALCIYAQIMDKFPNTEAAHDAAMSIENLRKKTQGM